MDALAEIRDASEQNPEKCAPKYDLPSWPAQPLKVPPQGSAMLLFPGEQTQYPGMLASCKDMHAVREMIELATEAFGFDVERAMDECGSEDYADRTDRSQMIAYVADCAAFEVLKEEHPQVAEQQRAVAGFSVGEFAALVAAGVISYEEGLEIVKARGEVMLRWADAMEMAALAVFGLDQDRIEKLCATVRKEADERESVRLTSEVYVSHFWGRNAFVCSGLKPAVEELEVLIKEVSEIPNSHVFYQLLEHHADASHTPLAWKVAQEVEAAIQSISMKPPNCEVYFNLGYWAPAGEDPSVFIPYLVQQLMSPLRWDGVLTCSLARGLSQFYECGPGHSLKDLMVFNQIDGSSNDDVRLYDMTKDVLI
eukprot:TRINITY_DN27820_c0_g1_i1.p1 TRINITY_DN27820_c0_g1~~TRINITY_DN27820_c0_g1_i1.p1  ORF type:complete len:367 (+),score=66.97 TRINITY_DN27820_c0_g1_i1:82-1182(+)